MKKSILTLLLLMGIALVAGARTYTFKYASMCDSEFTDCESLEMKSVFTLDDSQTTLKITFVAEGKTEKKTMQVVEKDNSDPDAIILRVVDDTYSYSVVVISRDASTIVTIDEDTPEVALVFTNKI